jgi:transcriptional regulator with XRE-family HTH domain
MDVRRKYFAMREIRLQRRISSAQVAMSIGISGERYLRIEKNEVKHITPSEKAMLCSFFGVEEDKLFTVGYVPYAQCSPCKTRILPLDEIEKLLAAEYGDKLKKRKMPIGCSDPIGHEKRTCLKYTT